MRSNKRKKVIALRGLPCIAPAEDSTHHAEDAHLLLGTVKSYLLLGTVKSSHPEEDSYNLPEREIL